jgi:succinate dehydrogenase/fumarate reductase flavoprotein subunit
MNAARKLGDADRGRVAHEDVLGLAADVLVLGGGPAGAWAAIAAAEAGASVVIADKGRLGSSGATAAVSTGIIDTRPGSRERDFARARRLACGGGLVSETVLETMLDTAHARLPDLGTWGYTFPKDAHGRIYRGHLRGPDLMQVLRRRCHQLGVRILDHCPAIALHRQDGEVIGAWGLRRQSPGDWSVAAGATVIATGGCAFQSKALGTFGLTGDGLLMAAEAGAVLSGMEFTGQYGITHVLGTVTKNLLYAWATFTNEAGEVLTGDDPFEIVARNLRFGTVYAMADKADAAIQEGLRRGQPNIFVPLDRLGIDPFRQRFPVTLLYEGTVRGVGGLAVAAGGETSVPRLFAAGDAASREAVAGMVSGGGGPNATWAIASGVQAGRSAARLALADDSRSAADPPRPRSAAPSSDPSFSCDLLTDGLAIVQSRILPVERSYFRSQPALLESAALLDALWADLDDEADRAGGGGRDNRSRLKSRELQAMAATARWITRSALAREESRGIHRRLDRPTPATPIGARVEVRGLKDVSVQAVPVRP